MQVKLDGSQSRIEAMSQELSEAREKTQGELYQKEQQQSELQLSVNKVCMQNPTPKAVYKLPNHVYWSRSEV